MKFITITPIWYNSTISNYQEASSKITIAVDSIEQITHFDPKHKIQYYTIWIKGKGHQDSIKTFDPIIDRLKDVHGVYYYEY
jgi:hypothetical protein